MSGTTGKKAKRLLIILVFILSQIGIYFLGVALHAPVSTQNDQATAETATEEQSDASAAEEQSDASVAAETMLTESPHSQAHLAYGSAEHGTRCPVSFFITDLQVQDISSSEIIEIMNSCKVSTLTIPLVWSFLEKEKGVFDPVEYDEMLEPYVKAGFHFIFLLDGAGRQITGKDGNVIANSLPKWLFEGENATKQRDFLEREDVSYGLSYSHLENLNYYLRFCEQAMDYFGSKYQEQVVGFAPGIMNEFEIKYPQTLYAWTDYSEDALSAFQEWLRTTYVTIDELNEALGTSFPGFSSITFPVINYNNTMTSGVLSDGPLFMDFQRFREQKILDYVVPVLKEIHRKGYRSIGYFGQTLSNHDAMYVSAIACKLAEYIDLAVIDYNFYDGYGEVYDSIIPAMMVNYMKNAGYREVWAGFYFERIPYLDHMDFLQQTIDYIAADGLAKGFEIGGIIDGFKEKGEEARPSLVYGIKDRSEQPRIAIYAGKWDFYKSHGEQVRYFNYFSDALAQMYKMVRFELNHPVDILCDETILREDLGKYDLFILPSQFYVETAVRKKIEQYLSRGGRAIMDLRFGEWNEKGLNTASWSDSFFGIESKQSYSVDEMMLNAEKESPLSAMKTYTLRSYYPAIPDLYALVPRTTGQEAKSLFTDEAGQPIGVYTPNTVVWGFQPQFQYKYSMSEEERKQAIQIVDLSIQYLLQ